eukprot:6180620-Pleurochrysis_carterae.AAC.3
MSAGTRPPVRKLSASPAKTRTWSLRMENSGKPLVPSRLRTRSPGRVPAGATVIRLLSVCQSATGLLCSSRLERT